MKQRKSPTLMPAVALAALGAVVAIPALSSSRLYAAPPARYAVVAVQRGDDLWTIASRFTPSGGNVQEEVDAIVAANRVDDGSLSPGQKLRIPR